MCGIVGYVGDKSACGIIVEGLKRLEYRGYDSAGVAVLQDGVLQVRRAAGKMKMLEGVLRERPVAGSLMEQATPPPAAYSDRIYRKVATYMSLRGMSADQAVAGCARCQACSALDAVQQPVLQIGRRPGSTP